MYIVIDYQDLADIRLTKCSYIVAGLACKIHCKVNLLFDYLAAEKHLDTVFEEVTGTVKECPRGQEVTLIQDGWSNIHNQPVIANVVHTGKRNFNSTRCFGGA